MSLHRQLDVGDQHAWPSRCAPTCASSAPTSSGRQAMSQNSQSTGSSGVNAKALSCTCRTRACAAHVGRELGRVDGDHARAPRSSKAQRPATGRARRGRRRARPARARRRSQSRASSSFIAAREGASLVRFMRARPPADRDSASRARTRPTTAHAGADEAHLAQPARPPRSPSTASRDRRGPLRREWRRWCRSRRWPRRRARWPRRCRAPRPAPWWARRGARPRRRRGCAPPR